jgi:hypothetical protein
MPTIFRKIPSMNAANVTIRQRERRQQLDNLNAAERALRANLHMHGLDETARQHMERALNHIREGYIAVNEPGRARNVQTLVETLDKVERLMEKLTANQMRTGAMAQTTG